MPWGRLTSFRQVHGSRLVESARLLSIPRCSMRRIVSVLVVLLLLVGCAKSNSRGGMLQGTLTYKGQPVNNAALRLIPASGSEGQALTIPVGADGTFRTTDVPEGDYKVVVQGSGATAGSSAAAGGGGAPTASQPTIAFPPKYKQLKTTTLTCKVAKGQQTLDLQLTD
jgi:hypothetical protein